MIGKLIIISTLIGVVSGLVITLYELAIDSATKILFLGDPFETVQNLPIWYIYLVPTVAIFIVNYIVSKDSHVREYSINDIADSIVQNKMIIKIKTLFLKVIASTLSLSSGFMVGTEGPSAGVGAMIAYHIHRMFRLPKALIKMIISVGASSAIAAIFVSPLTGIAFAVENLAHQFLKQYIGYLILASTVAFAISVQFLEPINFIYSIGREFDMEYIVANLLFIPFVTIFIYLYLFLKKKLLHIIDFEIFRTFSGYRNYIFALIGGGVVGTILLIEPHAAFSGKEIVMHLINQEKHIPILFIFLLIILRIIGTTVSIYSNAIGGLFLPLMSIGALVGYSFGEILNCYNFQVEVFSFAAIGAAVFMGTIMKLPLTAVVLAVETTFDYNIVVATGIGVVLIEYLSNLYFHTTKKGATKQEKL